jgi:hypothetical protein
MAAAAMKAPELKMGEKEAALLSERACKVAAHYNFAPSEKVQDWCALIMVAGQIYYPRVIMIKARLETVATNPHQDGVIQAGAIV